MLTKKSTKFTAISATHRTQTIQLPQQTTTSPINDFLRLYLSGQIRHARCCSMRTDELTAHSLYVGLVKRTSVEKRTMPTPPALNCPAINERGRQFLLPRAIPPSQYR